MNRRRDAGLRAMWLSVAFAVALAALVGCGSQSQGTGSTDVNGRVAEILTTHAVYVAPSQAGPAGVQAARRALERQAAGALKAGVDERFALVDQYPRRFHNASEAAESLRIYLDFSGVLVLVAPQRLGLSSDGLSAAQVAQVEHAAGSQCAVSRVQCALAAGRLAVAAYRQNASTSQHNAIVVWLAGTAVLLVLAAALALFMLRRRKAAQMAVAA